MINSCGPLWMLLMLTCSITEAGDVDVGKLLERHLESRGGRVRISAVDSLEATGTMHRFGLEYGLEWTYASPNTGVIHYWGENEHVQGVPGGFEAWMRFDGQAASMEIKPQDKPARDGTFYPWLEYPVRSMADFYGPLFDARAAGHTWCLEGREELEGEPVWRLDLERADSAGHEIWWISVETSDLVQRRFFFERWGRQVWATVTYTDFINVDGLRVAKTHLIDAVSATIEWSFREININPQADDTRSELSSPEAR